MSLKLFNIFGSKIKELIIAYRFGNILPGDKTFA